MISTQLNAVIINTAKLQDLLSFYQALGLEFTASQVRLGSEIYKTHLGMVEFVLYGIKSKIFEATPPFQLSFQVDDLQKTINKVTALGCCVLLEPFTNPKDGTPRAIVLDPDGHSVELTQI